MVVSLLPPLKTTRHLLASSLVPSAIRSAWMPLLMLMLITLTGAMPDPYSHAPAAFAGVAGGAGGAELADIAENGGSRPVNGSPVIDPDTGTSTGTIREALGGGVVEQLADDDGHQDRGEVVPGKVRSGGSRCSSPQACIRVEDCPPGGTDVLFECATGRVCCVPRAPNASTHAPAQRPQPQPNPSTAPTPQVRPQPSRPSSSAAPAPQAKPQPRPQPQPQSQTQSQTQQPQHQPQPQQQPQPQHQPQPQQQPQPQHQPQPQQPASTHQPQHPPQEQNQSQHQLPPPQQTQLPMWQQSPQPPSQHHRPHQPQQSFNPPSHSTSYKPAHSSPPQQNQQRPPASQPQHPYSMTPTQPHQPPVHNATDPSKPTAPPPSSLLPDTDVCGKVYTENRITYGKNADIGQFPWMALLGYNIRGSNGVSFLCGATLINERYVLTAAHCFSSSNVPVVVRLGEFNLTEATDCDHNNVCAPPPVDVGVEAVIPHPDFDFRTIKNDIALIRLAASVEIGEWVRPICLPLGVNVADNVKFKIAGWGKTDFKNAAGSPVLQYTDVGGVSQDECNELQPPELRPLDEGQLCAGGDKGKDACKGDSGGPLMAVLTQVANLDNISVPVTYQVGVVSYGPDSPCGTAPIPSVYTRVSSYVPWILATLMP